MVWSAKRTANRLIDTEPFEIHDADYTLLIKDSWDPTPTLSQISNTLTHYLKLYTMGLTRDVLKLGIIIDRNAMNKFKPSDPETTLDRLKIIISQFKWLKFDVHYTIFSAPSIPYVDHEICNSLWPLNTEWNGRGNFVCIKNTDLPADTPEMFDNIMGGAEFVKTKGTSMKRAIQFANENNYEIKYFGYETPYRELLMMFSEAKFIFSDRTTLLLFAIFMNAPTFMITSHKTEFYLDGKMRPVLFGSGNIGLSDCIDHVTEHTLSQEHLKSPIYNIIENTHIKNYVESLNDAERHSGIRSVLSRSI